MNLTHHTDGARDGKTFDLPTDLVRLNRQALSVYLLMCDGEWRTLARIAEATDEPEASVSARLRDLRKPRFGGYVVERRHRGEGIWEYRVLPPPPPPEPEQLEML